MTTAYWTVADSFVLPEISGLSTKDLLALCDRLYRELDREHPDFEVRFRYDEVVAELDHRAEF